jgi:aminopeptidase N
MARSAQSELERQELYEWLGSADDEALARQALDLVFKENFPPTFGPQILGRVANRHPELALDFAIANWDKLSKQLEVGNAHQYVAGVSRNSVDLKSIDKLNAFAAAHVPENARQDYVRAIARIRYVAKVRETRIPEVDRWVAAQTR